MSKHTPGPWHCHEKVGVYTKDGKLVASIHTPISDRSHDARLIAAAPELLEALRMFVVWYGLRDKHDTLLPPKMQEAELAQAMRAIAKAEGAPE